MQAFNQRHRAGTLSPGERETSELMSAYLAEHPLPKDVTVWRRTNSLGHFDGETAKVVESVLESSSILTPAEADSLLRTVVGNGMPNAAFTSTSFELGSHPKYGQYLFEIKLPKGTPALDISSISHHPGDHEILVDKGYTVVIDGVELLELGGGPTPRFRAHMEKMKHS